MAEQLSAEAQEMVDEGMRLAEDFSVLREAAYRIDRDEWWKDFDTAKSLLRAHLERMAAMAAPQGDPVAWVEVVCTHQGPYNFHGIKLLPTGKHELYTSPQPVAREPLSEGRIEAIMDEQYSPDISPADWCRATASAIEREIAQGEQP